MMRPAISIIAMALLLACSGSGNGRSGETTDTVQRDQGKGFWCVGHICFRTLTACNGIRSKESISGECERSATAQCFEGYDRDNMVSYTVCGRDGSGCARERSDYQREYDWMQLSSCRLTR